MPYDYSTAPAPRGDFEPIPAGTIATVSLHIKAGNAGEDGLLTRSQDGGCEMLVAEFTIIDGPYKGRKIWERMILVGSTPGHAQAADISRGTLKAILDATRGLKPDDMSDAARAARTVELKDFEGATFLAKIGIEKGGPIKNDGTRRVLAGQEHARHGDHQRQEGVAPDRAAAAVRGEHLDRGQQRRRRFLASC